MENHYSKTFRKLLRRLERAIFIKNNESCCNGVTLAQCHTLLEIESIGKESVTQLATNLGLDKSTVSRTVDGLVNVGLVDRSIPTKNRRMASIQLTESGKRICTVINNTNDLFFDKTLAILSEQEKRELIRLLEKVINKMIEIQTNDKKYEL